MITDWLDCFPEEQKRARLLRKIEKVRKKYAEELEQIFIKAMRGCA